MLIHHPTSNIRTHTQYNIKKKEFPYHSNVAGEFCFRHISHHRTDAECTRNGGQDGDKNLDDRFPVGFHSGLVFGGSLLHRLTRYALERDTCSDILLELRLGTEQDAVALDH